MSTTLHLLGGPKAFAEPLHVGRPNLGNRKRFLALVEQVLDRKWLSNDGPVLHAFETKIQEMLGVEHVVVASNATIAIELALRAVCGKGEVIVPSYTFVATAHAALWCGYTPVFADVNPHTHQLDAASVARCVSAAAAQGAADEFDQPGCVCSQPYALAIFTQHPES